MSAVRGTLLKASNKALRTKCLTGQHQLHWNAQGLPMSGCRRGQRLSWEPISVARLPCQLSWQQVEQFQNRPSSLPASVVW